MLRPSTKLYGIDANIRAISRKILFSQFVWDAGQPLGLRSRRAARWQLAAFFVAGPAGKY